MAITTLEAAILKVVDIVKAVDGVKAAPDYLPDSVYQYPMAICRPGAGTWEYGPGYGNKLGLHTIIVELMVPYKDMARDIQKLCDFLDTIPNAIMADPTLGATVNTFGTIRTDGIVAMIYNGMDMLAIRWYIDGVKLITAY